MFTRIKATILHPAVLTVLVIVTAMTVLDAAEWSSMAKREIPFGRRIELSVRNRLVLSPNIPFLPAISLKWMQATSPVISAAMLAYGANLPKPLVRERSGNSSSSSKAIDEEEVDDEGEEEGDDNLEIEAFGQFYVKNTPAESAIQTYLRRPGLHAFYLAPRMGKTFMSLYQLVKEFDEDTERALSEFSPPSNDTIGVARGWWKRIKHVLGIDEPTYTVAAAYIDFAGPGTLRRVFASALHLTEKELLDPQEQLPPILHSLADRGIKTLRIVVDHLDLTKDYEMDKNDMALLIGLGRLTARLSAYKGIDMTILCPVRRLSTRERFRDVQLPRITGGPKPQKLWMGTPKIPLNVLLSHAERVGVDPELVKKHAADFPYLALIDMLRISPKRTVRKMKRIFEVDGTTSRVPTVMDELKAGAATSPSAQPTVGSSSPSPTSGPPQESQGKSSAPSPPSSSCGGATSSESNGNTKNEGSTVTD